MSASAIDLAERRRFDLSRLKENLQVEKVYLRKELPKRTGTGVVIGKSHALRRVDEQVRQVAPTNSTVLLLGRLAAARRCSRPRSMN